MTLEIQNNQDNSTFTFEVVDTARLKRDEVVEILDTMHVDAIFIEGRLYKR